MTQIMLLQVAADNYNIEPRDPLGPGFSLESGSVRRRVEAHQKLGEGRGRLR